MFDETYWEERYSSHEHIWSGRPNVQLVAETSELTPGTALDVGCGEGADAVWLAERGWKVTAVDYSTTALERGAANDTTKSVEWVQGDMNTWEPGRRFDLISSQFTHPPDGPRQILFARLADMVAPGGTLLIVAHHPSDMETKVRPLQMPELFYTAEEVADSLAKDEWEIVTAEARPRLEKHKDGGQVTVHDTVLRARRRT
ncbi:class I SAM-dependent methyltransferase [Actinomadura rudentiformis]|uniref:Class I SAM-dependent methyltransferase n=1 Tax=Actinomadura rudentiformis TaxID=359158 RepID=A0A6H9YKG3_9ACTN|nr:class I SAM-dependent methyltransferase [Actinomadura rudentiformis]KAB2343377.1 class I SAM-dependent methyltransferase [Actinomadura rudentiformis]